MKKLVIMFVCLLASFAQAAFAQQPAAPTANPKGPQFKFKGGDVHDFGQVKKGPIVHYDFEFVNSGKEPLVIRDVNPSCGCTNAEWDKQPILPGKKGHIKVGLRTAEQHGNFMKEVYIQSNAVNAAADGRYTLHIKGTAIEDATATPATEGNK